MSLRRARAWLCLALVVAVGAALLPGGATAAPVRSAASPTTTTVLLSKNPIVVGELVTLRANVFVANSTIPASGTVTFLLNGLPLATGVAISGGVASYSTTLPAGTHTIGATYGGSGIAYTGSSGSAPITVAKASSSVTLTSSANPSSFGQYVTITATVSPTAPGAGTPTGTVSLPNSGLPAITLSGGTGTFTYSRGTAGSTSFQAVYNGDASFNGSTSATLSQVVNKGDVKVTFTASVNPTVYGQTSLMNVKVVAVDPLTGVPTGTVAFSCFGDGFPPATLTLSNGSATTGCLGSPATYQAKATYNGDANYNAGALWTLPYVVNKSPVNLSVLVNAPIGPVAYGTPLTFDVGVFSSVGARSPTGTLTMTALDAGGAATKALADGGTTFTTTAGENPSGVYTPSYSGDAYYLAKSGTSFTITLKKGTSAVLVSANGLPVMDGDSFTLLVEVAGPDADAGTVTISDAGQAIGSPVAVVKNLATIPVKASGAGKHTYKAAFSGTGNVDPSSGTIDVVVQPRPAAQAGTTTDGKPAAATTNAATPTTTRAGSVARPPAAGSTVPKPAAAPGRPGVKAGSTTTGAAAAKGAKSAAKTGSKPAAPKPKQKQKPPKK